MKSLSPPTTEGTGIPRKTQKDFANSYSIQPIKKVRVSAGTKSPKQDALYRAFDIVRHLTPVQGKISYDTVFCVLSDDGKYGRYARSLTLSGMRQFCRLYPGYRLVLEKGSWIITQASPEVRT